MPSISDGKREKRLKDAKLHKQKPVALGVMNLDLNILIRGGGQEREEYEWHL